jgi:hypothetical protein
MPQVKCLLETTSSEEDTNPGLQTSILSNTIAIEETRQLPIAFVAHEL